MMGVGHVTQRDMGRIGDEMSGVGPGLSGRRDRFGTEPGTSHNTKARHEGFFGTQLGGSGIDRGCLEQARD